MTAMESFHPRTEGLPWSHSIPEQNDSPRVVLSQDRITPLELFYPRTEGLPWSRSILGLNDSPGVVLSQDRRTPLKSFYPRTKVLSWSRSIPGQKDFPGVVTSQNRRAHLESFHPRTEGNRCCMHAHRAQSTSWVWPIVINTMNHGTYSMPKSLYLLCLGIDNHCKMCYIKCGSWYTCAVGHRPHLLCAHACNHDSFQIR